MSLYTDNGRIGLLSGETINNPVRREGTPVMHACDFDVKSERRISNLSTIKYGTSGFSVHCFWSSTGKLLGKEERGPFGRGVWTYSFDQRGHLLEVHKDGIVVERYTYDHAGRRTTDHLDWLGESRQFIYYYDGSLIRLDDEYLAWTDQGQLKTIYNGSRRCEFHYGSDTRLDSVLLPSGIVVGYEYGRELMPITVTEDGEVVAEFEWEDLLRLARSIDVRTGLVYTFFYEADRAPKRVVITGRPHAVHSVTGVHTQRLVLHTGVDQVDSVRVLATPEGKLVKYVEYDCFGNVTRDTRPELRLPLGFACGLNDRSTGFIRFGFRDYHPLLGRFTTKDPVGYTGGDNDLWDYCVDDPVSCIDPLGLWTKKTFIESRVLRSAGGTGSNESANNHLVAETPEQLTWKQREFPMWTLGPKHPYTREKTRGLLNKYRNSLYNGGPGGILDLHYLLPNILFMPEPSEELLQRTKKNHELRKDRLKKRTGLP